MKIIIKTKNFKLTRALKILVEEKISLLEKFIKVLYNGARFDSGKVKSEIQAFVEVGKETLHHKKGPYFKTECQIRFSGKSIRAEATSRDLRMAVDKVKDELQRELKKEKGKGTAVKKRRARALKREVKISPQARFGRKGRIRQEGL